MNQLQSPAPVLLEQQPAPVEAGGYQIALGYLRTFIVLLVVAHHAVLAYHPFARHSKSLTAFPPWWQIFPVVDPRRWTGFTFFVAFNDVFFMALMFFLSGLFVSASIRRKGAGGFFRDRLVRLGLPFLAAIALVSPLAYYPSWLQTGAPGGILAFARQWLALPNWPSGPAWFLWVLLTFDAIAALLFAVRRPEGIAPRRPIAAFAALVAISTIAYVPMARLFPPLDWMVIGPFAVQTGRAFHYLVYFLFGVLAGAYGIDRGFLGRASKLAQRWPLWTTTAVAAFASVIVFFNAPVALTAMLFVVCCAACSFAALALSGRFANSRNRVLDSLRDNSYGIYLVHYAFVSWLQYALLRAPVHALAKGCLVTAGAIALSWATAAALRRIPLIDKVL